MKSIITRSILSLALITGLTLSVAIAADESDAALKAEAKITQTDAQKTALTKAPDGTIKSSELEKEKGKLIWSFDIARPGTKDITEVQVDAKTGKIVSVAIEKAADQAKEAKEDMGKK